MSSSKSFPVEGLLPKIQTQAAQFLEQHPLYDGRGVRVAILDTGVDLGAAGLSLTTEGKPKMIDCQDTSGGGDVDTSKVVKSKSGNTIKGLTGLSLTLGSGEKWTNPSGEWRVGTVPVYRLFPSALTNRMKRERKEIFMNEHDKATAIAVSNLDTFDQANPGPKLDPAKLLERKELQAKVDTLAKYEKNYKDYGPTVDCVVFKDEKGIWRGVVDTRGDGDLTASEPMTNFSVEHQFQQWDEITLLNYCLNVYEDGNVLSICVDSGAHGTHVAAIVGSYFPDQPELNGVAPGVELMSYKIGDGRLDGMETGTAIIRALNACVTMGADVINMSFGEPTMIPDGGRVAELVREIVEKHGVVFVSSAGNAGPALSTVGAPGSTTNGLIGVGAYVEPQMMSAEYSMREGAAPRATNYEWSSRGPSYDGQLGVSISAPGGAIASVPQWTLQKKRLMNGTSMASPNAAGGVALILSGLKALGLWYSPHRIRRALEVSACPVPGVEPHALGHGLIQVLDAFEAAKQSALSKNDPKKVEKSWILDIPFRVTVPDRPVVSGTPGFAAAGLYLREPFEAVEAREYGINVQPVFAADEADPRVGSRVLRFSKADRNQVELQVELVSTVSWISAPSHVLMGASGRLFNIWVDPCGLPVNDVAFGEVLGFDPRSPRAVGPLFRVPVTVVRPMSALASVQSTALVRSPPPAEASAETVEPAVSLARLRLDPAVRFAALALQPGEVVRHFIGAPPGATLARVTLRPHFAHGQGDVPQGSTPGAPQKFFLHCLQMANHSNYRADENKYFFSIQHLPNEEFSREFAVQGNRTLEVCLAQFWSSPGCGAWDVEVRFYGLSVSPQRVLLSSENGLQAQVDVTAELSQVKLAPSASLNEWLQSVSPKVDQTRLHCLPMETRNSVLGIEPSDQRPTFALDLVYSFKQAKEGKVKVRVPKLNDLLYDSPVDAQLCMLFNKHKEIIATQDAFPGSVTCPEGDITVRLQVRHETRSVLESLKSLHITVTRPLSPSVSLKCTRSAAGTMLGKDVDAFRRYSLGLGQSIPVIVGVSDWAAAADSLPKGAQPGDILLGNATFAKLPKNKIPVRLVLPTTLGSPKKGPSPKPSDTKSDKDQTSEEKKLELKREWNRSLVEAKIKLLRDTAPDAAKACAMLSPEEKGNEETGEDAIDGEDATVQSESENENGEEDKVDHTATEIEFFEFQFKEVFALADALEPSDRERLVVDLLTLRLSRHATAWAKCKNEKLSLQLSQGLIDVCEQVVEECNPDELRSELNAVSAKIKGIEALESSAIPDELKKLNERLDAKKSLLCDALVTRAAVMWFGLQQGNTEGTDVTLQQTAEVALSQASEWCNLKGNDFTFLLFLHAKALNRYGLAHGFLSGIKLSDADKTPKSSLHKLLNPKIKISPSSILEYQSELVQLMKWNHLEAANRDANLVRFPKAYPLF